MKSGWRPEPEVDKVDRETDNMRPCHPVSSTADRVALHWPDEEEEARKTNRLD